MKRKPIGVTMGTNGVPTLAFDGRSVYADGLDRTLYPEYYPGDCHWPQDPYTGKDMPAVPMSWYDSPIVSRWEKNKKLISKYLPW